MTSTSVRTESLQSFIDGAAAMAAALPTGVPAPGEPDCGDGGDGDGWCGIAAGARSPGRTRGLPLLLCVAALLALAAAGCRPRAVGNCEGGKQHGFGPPKDRLMWCTDERGKKHGVFREWWPSDQLKLEAHYKQGVQHGKFVKYHFNGQKELEGEYVDGLKKGRWVEYYEDGKVRREMDYLEDTEIRWTLYNEEEGAKWMVGRHQHHQENGHFIEWAANGQKIAEGEFRNGAKAGTWSYWNDDGTPSAEQRGAYAPGAFGEE